MKSTTLLDETSHILKIPIYDMYLLITRNESDFYEACVDFGVKKDSLTGVSEDLESGPLGLTVSLPTEAGPMFLGMYVSPYCNEPLITSLHEICHVSWNIMHICGIDLSIDNHEAQAYLQSYLTRKIIKKWKI